MKYFKRWYDEQKPELQNKVKELVKEGQLDLVGGGWSSPDEACPSFEDLIDNMMIAHSFL